MAGKKKKSFAKIIFHLFTTVPSLFGITLELLALVKLEARLAKRSLIKIWLCYIFLGCLFFSLWGSLLVFIFFYLAMLNFSYLTIMLILIMFNFFSLLLTLLYFLKLKDDLSFVRTRKIVSRLMRSMF